MQFSAWFISSIYIQASEQRGTQAHTTHTTKGWEAVKSFLKTYKTQHHIRRWARYTPDVVFIRERALGPLCAKTLWDFNIYIKRIIIQKLTCSMRRCRRWSKVNSLIFLFSAGGARGLGGGGANTHRAEAEIEFLHVFLFSVNAAKLFRLRCWLLLRSSQLGERKCKHTYTHTNRHRNGLPFLPLPSK
jgi:hypothetical protein